jgi:hypothetical protein
MGSRLLMPFTDVLCIFASDMGGFRVVVSLLADWLRGSNVSFSSPFTRPAVVVVTDKVPVTRMAEVEARKAFLWMLQEETSDDPFNLFSSIDVVAVPPRRAFGAPASMDRLQERLQTRAQDIEQSRRESRTLYSLTHFAAFLEMACQHFSASRPEPFDFVKAARFHNPPSPELSIHLETFLTKCETAQDLMTFAAPMIASSFLLDSYPPDCHRELCCAERRSTS